MTVVVLDEKKLYCACKGKFDLGPMPASVLQVMMGNWLSIHCGGEHRIVSSEEYLRIVGAEADDPSVVQPVLDLMEARTGIKWWSCGKCGSTHVWDVDGCICGERRSGR